LHQRKISYRCGVGDACAQYGQKRRAGKARRRRCPSFAPPEPGRYSGKLRAEPRPAGRPQFRRLLAGIGPRDVVMVTRLERLARSIRDLLNTLAAITAKKASFKSLGDTWADTTTSHGRLMLTVLGGLAEFECDLIRARTGEGRARAVARGQKMGRPFKLTDHQKREAIKRREQGETLADIGRSYNVSPATISRLTT
jgi:DNA invertase Pin-like site-specific DNA recombinase